MNPRHDTCELVAFAAGCFWHVEEAFRVVPGVMRTQAGYAAGPPGVRAEATPCRRDTGHVAQYRYRSAILVSGDEHRAIAERAVEAEQRRRGPHVTVTTTVHVHAPFQPAAASNQQYLLRRATARAGVRAGTSR